jgi:hypothetical protein
MVGLSTVNYGFGTELSGKTLVLFKVQKVMQVHKVLPDRKVHKEIKVT